MIQRGVFISHHSVSLVRVECPQSFERLQRKDDLKLRIAASSSTAVERFSIASHSEWRYTTNVSCGFNSVKEHLHDCVGHGRSCDMDFCIDEETTFDSSLLWEFFNDSCGFS